MKGETKTILLPWNQTGPKQWRQAWTSVPLILEKEGWGMKGGRRELFVWPPTVHFMLQSVPSDFHKATLHFLISFSEKERQAWEYILECRTLASVKLLGKMNYFTSSLNYFVSSLNYFTWSLNDFNCSLIMWIYIFSCENDYFLHNVAVHGM